MMTLYGDRGNVISINEALRVARIRGVVRRRSRGKDKAAGCDLFLFGGGPGQGNRPCSQKTSLLQGRGPEITLWRTAAWFSGYAAGTTQGTLTRRPKVRGCPGVSIFDLRQEPRKCCEERLIGTCGPRPVPRDRRDARDRPLREPRRSHLPRRGRETPRRGRGRLRQQRQRRYRGGPRLNATARTARILTPQDPWPHRPAHPDRPFAGRTESFELEPLTIRGGSRFLIGGQARGRQALASPHCQKTL